MIVLGHLASTIPGNRPPYWFSIEWFTEPLAAWEIDEFPYKGKLYNEYDILMVTGMFASMEEVFLWLLEHRTA